MTNHTTSSKDLILARTLYISVWAAVTIFALLCENDLLPIESTQQHFKQNERTAQLELAAYLYLGFQHHRQPYYLLRISQ